MHVPVPDIGERLIRDSQDEDIGERLIRDTQDDGERLIRDTQDDGERLIRDTLDDGERLIRDTLDDGERLIRDTQDDGERLIRDTQDENPRLFDGRPSDAVQGRLRHSTYGDCSILAAVYLVYVPNNHFPLNRQVLPSTPLQSKHHHTNSANH